jgi:hypothetical protein
VHGDYCGVGHGDPTRKTPPIDAVDLVCREHDRCYGLLGAFDSRRDRNLIQLAPMAIEQTPSLLGKQVGIMTLVYFALANRTLASARSSSREPDTTCLAG